MKKYLLTVIAFVIGAVCVEAQTLNVCNDRVTYSFPAVEMNEAEVTADGNIVIMGRIFTQEEMKNVWVDTRVLDDNTVVVTYNDVEADVVIAGNIAHYVNATVSGSKVNIVQSDEVDDTVGEITYLLTGNSSDGSFTANGSYKSTLRLEGLDLVCTDGAAIEIKNGKRLKVSIAEGTENTLGDDASGSQKGCLSCTGHIEFVGKGILNISGAKSHAIYAKEYVTMKNCTINVRASVKDGVNCNQYFSLNSGILNLEGIGDDGIQVSYKDSENREEEDTGAFLMSGGQINVTVTADAAKAIKCEGDMTLTGGKITASVSGGGVWDSEKLKTKGASCLSADGNIRIDGITLVLNATGSGGKGINTDGTLTVASGDISIGTTGGIFAYVNGKTYDNYTGNTDNLDSDQKSSAKGIKADGNITINGGSINVVTTGNGSEGIESKSEFTINSGTIVAYTNDDALNSGSHLYINGGDITVVATNNDGIDSNGNLYIQGGTVRAFGARSPECGLDANEEEGYSVFFTGGNILAVGGSNSTPSSSQSTQAYIIGSGSVSAGRTIAIKNGNEVLVSFVVPENYTASSSGFPGGGNSGSILVSCPDIQSGGSYTLLNGTSSSSVTARTTGGGGMGGRF